MVPWEPMTVTRHELHVAADHVPGAVSHVEVVATPARLVHRITERGIPEGLPDDTDLSELARASIVEVAGISIMEVAIGHLTGCVFPGLEHDCPKGAFQCGYSCWQARQLNQLDDGDLQGYAPEVRSLKSTTLGGDHERDTEPDSKWRSRDRLLLEPRWRRGTASGRLRGNPLLDRRRRASGDVLERSTAQEQPAWAARLPPTQVLDWVYATATGRYALGSGYGQIRGYSFSGPAWQLRRQALRAAGSQ